MNKAVYWLENDENSRYRLSRCDLAYMDMSWSEFNGETMRFFYAKYGESRPGASWMLSLKDDDETDCGMRWFPEDLWDGSDMWTGDDFD